MTQQRSLLLFEQAIKSEVTKKSYLYQLNKFKKWAKIKDFNGLHQAPQKDIQILLEDYVMYLKNTISPNSIPNDSNFSNQWHLKNIQADLAAEIQDSIYTVTVPDNSKLINIDCNPGDKVIGGGAWVDKGSAIRESRAHD